MSAARDLSKLGNTDVFTVDTAAGRVGVDSTSPVGEFQVGAAITVGSASGIISATAFYGDGSNLEGVSSAGLGTALAEEGAGSVIYYTDSTLGIGSTVNVLVPNGSDVAYTQYSEIAPDENVDVIVADGDDFIVDVLGISTAGGISGTPAGAFESSDTAGVGSKKEARRSCLSIELYRGARKKGAAAPRWFTRSFASHKGRPSVQGGPAD